MAIVRRHWLELCSRLVLVGLFTVFVLRAWDDYVLSPAPFLLLLVVAECLSVLVAVLARFTDDVDRSWRAAALTFVGSFYFLVVDVSDDGLALLPALGYGLQFGGVSLQIASKVWLGRSFGLLPAHRGLVTRGPYALVRHPMYLAYFMNHVGFMLQRFTLWNLGVYAALYTIQLLRIALEERWLGRDPEYRAYAARVRFRFLPGIW